MSEAQRRIGRLPCLGPLLRQRLSNGHGGGQGGVAILVDDALQIRTLALFQQSAGCKPDATKDTGQGFSERACYQGSQNLLQLDELAHPNAATPTNAVSIATQKSSISDFSINTS
jgi:hypothetical protein